MAKDYSEIKKKIESFKNVYLSKINRIKLELRKKINGVKDAQEIEKIRGEIK